MPHENLHAAADARISIRVATTTVEAHATFEDNPASWQRIVSAIATELNAIAPPEKGEVSASDNKR